MSRGWKWAVLILFLWSALSTWRQLEQAQQFMAQGPRFTAQDGQALCERVRALEARSYGFEGAGQMPTACHYNTPSEPR